MRQKMMRSMTTAREMMEQASSGTMTGPPLMMIPTKSNIVRSSILLLIADLSLLHKQNDLPSFVTRVMGLTMHSWA